MKFRFIGLVFVVWCNASWADFSNISQDIHPNTPISDPFILEITGDWPTDCHPGEQKPVIRQYDKGSALVEFETIVEHVTCNEVSTPYRVLIDMSDIDASVEGRWSPFVVTIRFDGFEYKAKLTLAPSIVGPPPPVWFVNPEAGLYHSDGLEKQGLLLARQNQRMAVYPLIYDDSGSSEWLIGPGGIVEDVFFSELFELTGGQCLGCPPPDEPTELNKVGKLTMLMDSEGLIQVKVNDGLFKPYQQSEFGYGGFDILDADDETLVRVPDLSGRWAFSGNNSYWWLETTSPPTSVLPLVFDVTLRSNVSDPPPPTIGAPPPITGSPHNVFYSILNMDGEQVAQMLCEYRDEMVCDLKTPDIEIGDYDEWYKVQLLSVERMIITNTEPLVTEEYSGTGTAVRID